jgi:hypothetical protein
MKAAKIALAAVIGALLLLGMVYIYILPFTPAWFDQVALIAIALAFLVAFIIGKT